MDDRSWMYRDSPQGLRRMDYCNGVQGFINFATSIPRNFTGGGIRCPCRKCQNKKYLHPDVVMMHLLLKRFMENYQCWYAHGEVFVNKRRMRERVVGSTSSASNVHEAANDNTNPYRNMVMDAMRMNQGKVSQCPIVEEEPNADAARFFDLLKDSDEPLWDGCTNHSKLSAVAQVFTIKSDHRLSEAGYDKIIEWARSILPDWNRLKENLYAAKSMMKPLGLGYQKIDMCHNLCMLYYLENAEMTECMTCGHSRYKPRTGRGKTLVAYNNGVCVKGSTSSELEVDYYGKLEEVVEVQYHSEQNRVFLFKCYWYDTTDRGIRVDPPYGLVEINSKARLRNVNDVFVFAKQCQQVYYTYTPSFRKDRSRVDWVSVLIAPSVDLEENSNFRVFDDSLVDVDAEELNVVLSSSEQANVDEDDDHIEDCDEGDDYSIDDEEEENSD